MILPKHEIIGRLIDFILKRQERERSSVSAAGCRQRVTVQALTPFDRIAPMGTGGTPITGNASEVSIGDAAFTSKTLCRSSVFFVAVAL